jgi:hypothetical protein
MPLTQGVSLRAREEYALEPKEYLAQMQVQCLCRSGLNPTPRTSSTTLLEQPARKNNNKLISFLLFIHSFIGESGLLRKEGA